MKLKVQNVGRISKGEFGTKRLTMFIGQNDSGKTYAASTIWAVLCYIKESNITKINSGFQKIEEFISSVTSGDVGKFELTVNPSEIKEIRDSVFKSLNKDIRHILHNAIGYDGFSKSKVTIGDGEQPHPFTIRVLVKKHETFEEVEVASKDDKNSHEFELKIVDRLKFSCTIVHEGIEKEYFSSDEFKPKMDGFYFIAHLRRGVVGVSCLGIDWLGMRDVIYIPAARAGIMLSLDDFVSGALDRNKMSEREIEEGTALPGPIQDFVTDLSRSMFPLVRKRRDHILEKLIPGKLSRRYRTHGYYVYSIEDEKGDIPLASTSSLVTELAAFLVLYPPDKKRTLLIFEAPEAHLHLSAQREMARILAKMVNSGNNILITTHSDTFLQQLNNLISLHHLRNNTGLKHKLGLPEDAIIDPDSVAAFDFDRIDGVTDVKMLEINKYGVVANSLNRVLLELADETIQINDALSDLDN